MGIRGYIAVLAAVASLALAACVGETPTTQRGQATESARASAQPEPPAPAPSPPLASNTAPSSPPATPPTGSPPLGTVPPPWLGTRVLPRDEHGFGVIRPTPRVLQQRRFTLPGTLPPLPGRGFASRVTPVPRQVLARSTWRPGCPVAAHDLRWVRLVFWGFDERRHTGELLVHRAAARDLVSVFARLYRARFPIEEMRITRRAEQTAPPTGDGNNTGAFNCRPARGQTSYSEHAYGLAVDVNPFQNPYLNDGIVLPELASAYLRRGWHRPGMIRPDGVVVRAFAAIGWEWGGAWRTLKDYQHFSATGR